MKKTFLLGLTAITLALTSSTARAGDVRFSFSIGLPLPRLYVTVPPATVCVTPAPAPVCVTPPPPVCVTPSVVYVQGGYCHPGCTHPGHWVHYGPGRGHAKYVYVAQPGYHCNHGY